MIWSTGVFLTVTSLFFPLSGDGRGCGSGPEWSGDLLHPIIGHERLVQDRPGDGKHHHGGHHGPRDLDPDQVRADLCFLHRERFCCCFCHFNVLRIGFNAQWIYKVRKQQNAAREKKCVYFM